jgi:hypothetical protein
MGWRPRRRCWRGRAGERHECPLPPKTGRGRNCLQSGATIPIMVFPLNQSGTLRCRGQNGSASATAQRIAEALLSETVDGVEVVGSVVTFVRSAQGNVPRPGGQFWRFGVYDRGTVSVEGQGTLRVRYCFSTAKGFQVIACLSLSVAVPGLVWPWPWFTLSTFVFASLFGGNYVITRVRLPLWLRKVASSPELPEPRPLELDSGI